MTAILLSVHTILHAWTDAPELELEQDEARNVANAIKGVADQYDFTASEKSLAWANLHATLALVYGSRLFAFRTRKKMERAARAERAAQEKTGNITVLKPGA